MDIKLKRKEYKHANKNHQVIRIKKKERTTKQPENK